MTKEQAQKAVEEARELGIAFVDDEYRMMDDGSQIYNPTVKNVEAESWLLDKLMGV